MSYNDWRETYKTFLLENSADLDVKKREWKRLLKLTSYEKTIILSILKQTTFKLGIINHGTKLKVLVPDECTKPSMNERFKEPIMDKLYDEKTLEPLRECFDVMTETKLTNDIEQIRLALEMFWAELTTENRFETFANYLLNECQEAHDEYLLIENFRQKTSFLQNLTEKLKELRHKSATETERLDERLFQLKTECDDRRTKMKMESNLISKWERGRQEQTQAIFNHENQILIKKQTKVTMDTDRESIAINELRTFYNLKCENLNRLIREWKKCFAEEKKNLDQQINETRENVAQVKEKHENIRKLYEERDAFIRDYRAEQMIRKIQRELEAKQCAAAVRLQAWWRATMVRKQLGPYRQRKKSKKPKKK